MVVVAAAVVSSTGPAVVCREDEEMQRRGKNEDLEGEKNRKTKILHCHVKN